MSPRENIDCRSAANLVSEALDQRLGHGDARRFRAHILKCQDCRRLFDGMRRLQSATRNLAPHPVSRGFRTELIERIGAGEGTPPAILDGPVPVARRIKLFASGAATAAALLLSVWLVFDNLQRERDFSGADDGAVPAGLPEGQAMVTAGVDPVWLSRKALEKGVTNFNGLQQEAPRYLTLPYKRAFRVLIDRSENALCSIDFVDSLNGSSLELPPPVERRVREIRSVLTSVVGKRHQEQYGPSDVLEIVTLLQRPKPLSREETQCVRIRYLRELELKDVFPQVGPDQKHWVRMFEFLMNDLLRDFEQDGVDVGSAIHLNGQPLYLELRTMPAQRTRLSFRFRSFEAGK